MIGRDIGRVSGEDYNASSLWCVLTSSLQMVNLNSTVTPVCASFVNLSRQSGDYFLVFLYLGILDGFR